MNRASLPSITGVVITLNEEKNIIDCLRSLKTLCDHLVVVDSGSKDATCELARLEGAEVIHQPYLGDGPQKNVSVDHAKTDWVFSLDADERLTPEVIEAVRKVDFTQYDSFAVKRRNFIGSRWIRYGGWYPDYCVRLFDKRSCRFSDVQGHSSVTGKNTLKLEASILHYSYTDVGQLFAKANSFSSRGAKGLYRAGKKTGPFSAPSHGMMAFLKSYFLQRGILGGSDGFTVALSAAINSFLKYAKLREMQKDEKVRKTLDTNGIW